MNIQESEFQTKSWEHHEDGQLLIGYILCEEEQVEGILKLSVTGAVVRDWLVGLFKSLE